MSQKIPMNEKVNAAIAALKNNKPILLMDDAKRENEADLVFPAEIINSEIMNFMIRHTSGIVCVALPESTLRRLNLSLLVAPEENKTAHTTPFAMPVDAAYGITTGVSAADRTKTIKILINDDATPADLVRPGHVYPLKAKSGGVLERAGHTEGSLDLITLAGFKPGAIICELMNPDGTMAKGQAVLNFAKQHDLPVISIQDLIEYRSIHESLIQEKASATICLSEYGDFELTVWKEKYTDKEHVSLFKPMSTDEPLLVRIHSSCATGDIFHSLQCDCHQQLHYALKKISETGGLLCYLDQEGRGIGLLNKIKTYALQKEGLDTIEANQKLDLPVDMREYYIPAQILRDLEINSVRLLTNNPAKLSGLLNAGLEEVIREPIPLFAHEKNKKYLKAKQEKLGHFINLETVK